MKSDDTEVILTEIAQILAEDDEYPLDGTLLYAEVDYNFVAPSIFKNRDVDILYRPPDLDRLGDALLALWNAQAPGKQWEAIEYVISGGRFKVTFTYPEDIDHDEDPADRRHRVVVRHFGDKPVVYPPLEQDENTFDL